MKHLFLLERIGFLSSIDLNYSLDPAVVEMGREECTEKKHLACEIERNGSTRRRMQSSETSCRKMLEQELGMR